MNWRSLFGALYAQDTIRMSPKLTLTLGFRDEFSTGWNEAHGRAANYTFTDGVISSQPRIASDAFTVNNAKFLPQPRVGLAWSPYQGKTVVRAGFGMYNDLQDALGYRMDQNAPFNPTYSIASLPVSQLPINPALPGAEEGAAGARRRSAQLADADADLVLAANRAGTHAEHFFDHRLRGLARLPRASRCRCQHTGAGDLSGVAMSRRLSGKLPGAAGGIASSGRKLLHPCGNA